MSVNFKRFIAAVMTCTVMTMSCYADVESVVDSAIADIDSLQTKALANIDSATVSHSSTRWIGQLIENKFHINDPNIYYPRFPRFLRNVYNWGDRTFNRYDTTYVEPTGKNWKLLWKSYNWANSYMMIFPRNTSVMLMSDINADIGGYLCFMAVSVGYMFNANQLIHHTGGNRHNFNFNFTCALFSGDINYSSTTGGVKIKKFGDYLDGAHISVPLENVKNTSLTTKLYYFFNHRKYSHAAAYCYSKHQLKSAGTWIAGIATARQEISIDFSHLPDEMLQHLPMPTDYYNFHYRDYNILGGYAHNWVLKPRRWLINLTFLPSLGYKHSFEDASDGRRDMFSTNLHTSFAVVYNHRQLFCALNGRFDGFFYFTKNYTFLNSQESLLATVGVRF